MVEGNAGLAEGTVAALQAVFDADEVPFIVAAANAASTCDQWRYVSGQLVLQETNW